ncbi:MAG TPA: sugar ABC transporter permease [Fimbriimonadaceae bacterium]|nr:sugar ABC transporter permease [Fimbriimonadaceae bacterium]
MSKRGRGLFIVSFLAPAVLIYAGVVVYPLIQSFALSTYQWSGLSNQRKYVGAQNFVKLAHDDIFWEAVRNNLSLLVVGGAIILAIAVAVAHGIQGSGRLSKTLRSVVLFPQMISLVAVAILWLFVLNPEFGLVTSFLNAVHLEGWVHTWLGEPRTALGSVGVAFAWYAVGFYIMLFAAGLKAIPADIYEASELDGAVGLRRFWKVTWPMLWSVKRIAVVHIAITVVNVFALVYLMTQGGPDHSTEVMLTYLYSNAFLYSKFGYGTAIAVANFVIVMLIAAAILLAFRRDPTERRTA